MLKKEDAKVTLLARKRNDKILRIQEDFENAEKIQENIIHMHRLDIANDASFVAAPGYK
jgi:hypothetical protein